MSEENKNTSAKLLQMIMGFQLTQAIYVAAALRLPDLLKDGAKTSEDLAEATTCHPEALYRLMRLLAGAGILDEISSHKFSLTEMGQLLLSDTPGSLHPIAMMQGSRRQWLIWQHLLYSVQTGQSAVPHVFGIETWEYFAQNPDEGLIFYTYMTALSNMLAPAIPANYSFEGVQTIADVGGGYGTLLSSILKSNPRLKGVLFDLPNVTTGAHQLLEAGGVAERCEIISGDIFLPWPFRADIYLISRVLHDWDDMKCVSILSNCRQAMVAGSKVLLVERILANNKTDRLVTLMSDLQMLVGPGGKERTEAEFRRLFEAAGLKLTRTIPITSPYYLIEGEIA